MAGPLVRFYYSKAHNLSPFVEYMVGRNYTGSRELPPPSSTIFWMVSSELRRSTTSSPIQETRNTSSISLTNFRRNNRHLVGASAARHLWRRGSFYWQVFST